MPAAAISGVQWSAFGSFGSAPSSTSFFMIREVGRHGSQQERRRAGPIQHAASRSAPFQASVDVSTVFHEFLDELKAGQFSGADGWWVAALVIAAVRLADPGQGVEGREAGSLIVRIGSRVQQDDGQLKVSVLDRKR